MINTEENTFYSSKNPSIRIELTKEYQYLGTIDKAFQARTSGDTGKTLNTERDIYLYGSITNNNYMNKLIGITVLKLKVGQRWHPQTMLIVTNTIKCSVVKLDAINFEYCIKAKETTSNIAAQFLLEKGITTPNCYMSMLLGRVFGDNIKMYISYYEDFSNYKEFGINSCEDWNKKEEFDDKQKEYLEEFEKRAHNSMKIL